MTLGLILCLFPAHARESRYASIVMDAETGGVILASNPDKRVYPASLTKIMTLYLVFDALESGRLRLDTPLKVSAHAAAQAPSKLDLRPGETIRVEDVVLALVTKSANDAAVVAAEGVGGSEAAFAEMMNRKARQLGMKQSTFRNASGLPNPNQVTTAQDMAVLARALIRNHGRYYHYFSTRQFNWRGQPITTHNRLMLRYQGADGIKTGYINASGFNLVASAKRDGRRLIGVVFGGDTSGWRDNHMAQLLDRGFARINSGTDIRTAGAEGVDDLLLAAKGASQPKKPAAKPVRVASARPVPDGDGIGDSDPALWSIQVGAFSVNKAAQHAAASALKTVGSLSTRAAIDVDKVRQGNKSLWRARVSGFTEDQARAACKKLTRARKDCKVVQPSA